MTQETVPITINWKNPGLILKACLHPLRFKQAYAVALVERKAKLEGRPYEKTVGEDGVVSIVFKK